MKIMVTGGGGFIGSHIVRQLLQRGDTAVAVNRSSYPGLRDIGAETLQGDIRDRDFALRACRGCDAVIHTAAKTGNLFGRFQDYYENNVAGTGNIIEACRRSGIARLVFTSSPSVVFDNRPQEGVNESRPYPLRYESPYPRTKALAEQMVLQANGRDGLLTTSIRPHIVWGPGDTQILPRLLARAKAGQIVQVGDGTNKVDMTYVEDAARAHLLALDALRENAPAAGSAYFISQNEPVVLWVWVRSLLKTLGLPPISRSISLPLARTLGNAFELAYRLLPLHGEPRLTRFLATELAVSHYYDISRARRDFGYEPQFTMDQAMEKTLPYLRGLIST